MCFSAPASFIASGVLGTTGVATITRTPSREKWISFIPFLFAIQQLSEGLQWISPHPSLQSTILAYIFLFFGFLLWPVYMPFSVFKAAKDSKEKSRAKAFLIAGSVVTLYLTVVLLTQPLSINILSHSVNYDMSAPHSGIMAAMHIFVVTGSLIFSSKKFLRNFGFTVLVAAGIAQIIFSKTFISVWCFFGAILSLIIYFHYKNYKETPELT